MRQPRPVAILERVSVEGGWWEPATSLSRAEPQATAIPRGRARESMACVCGVSQSAPISEVMPARRFMHADTHLLGLRSVSASSKRSQAARDDLCRTAWARCPRFIRRWPAHGITQAHTHTSWRVVDYICYLPSLHSSVGLRGRLKHRLAPLVGPRRQVGIINLHRRRLVYRADFGRADFGMPAAGRVALGHAAVRVPSTGRGDLSGSFWKPSLDMGKACSLLLCAILLR